MNYNIYEELSKLNESTNSKNFDAIIEEALNTCAEALVQDICESLDADFDYISKVLNFEFTPDFVLETLKNGDIKKYLSDVVERYTYCKDSYEYDKWRKSVDADRAAAERVKEIRGVFPDFYDEEGNLIK